MYAFDFVRPATVEEALMALGAEEAQALGGGQTLIPTLKQRLAQPGTLVSLTGIASIKGVGMNGGQLAIGGGTTHAAVAREAAAAAPDDPRQFVAQQLQLRDLRLDLFQMPRRDAVGLAAVAFGMVRQVEQGADFLDREAQVTRMAHEGQPRPVRLAIAAVIGRGAMRFGEQSDALIIADRLDIGAGHPREFADFHALTL